MNSSKTLGGMDPAQGGLKPKQVTPDVPIRMRRTTALAVNVYSMVRRGYALNLK